jgi:hypothetical protein
MASLQLVRMLMPSTWSHSMAEETSPPPSTPKPASASARFQAIVATLAGIASIGGAALSLVQYARPGNTGELVAIVHAAGSERSVPDATVEVLTSENALVTTLTPDAEGRATQELREGVYVVRVSHPRYAADVHRIQVQPKQTTEITATLHAGTSSPIKRAVNKGVGAARRALGF